MSSLPVPIPVGRRQLGQSQELELGSQPSAAASEQLCVGTDTSGCLLHTPVPQQGQVLLREGGFVAGAKLVVNGSHPPALGARSTPKYLLGSWQEQGCATRGVGWSRLPQGHPELMSPL